MEYKVRAVEPRNEWNAGYGDMKDYAIALEGEQGWIKLTQKLQTPPPQVGDTLYGVIENRKTKNGNPYTKFKKMQRDQTASQGTQPTSVDNNKLDYIVQMLEELTGRKSGQTESPQDVGSEAQSEVDTYDDPFEDLGI